MHPYVKLAYETIRNRLEGKEPPAAGPDFPQTRAAVFVTLHKEEELRGCIGTLVPRYERIEEEIRHNAICAAFEDPRFLRVTLEELASIDVSVDVLSRPEPVAEPKDLDPKRYGVIVESGKQRGVLLPDLDGVDTAEEQIDIAVRKAGIREGERVQLYRFTVERFG